jgi:hypothetical protein
MQAMNHPQHNIVRSVLTRLLWTLFVALQCPPATISETQALTAISFLRRSGSRFQERGKLGEFRATSIVAAASQRKVQYYPTSKSKPPSSSSATAFVPSLKNPFFSWWRRFRKIPCNLGLSAGATQDHEEATATRTQQDIFTEENRLESSEESVHLGLTQQQQQQQQQQPPPQPSKETKNKVSIVQELAFRDPIANTTWTALNTCRRKFISYLDYHGVNMTEVEPSQISEKQIELSANERGQKQKEWREQWKDRRLLTDRTEFLAVYQSDQQNLAQVDQQNLAQVNGDQSQQKSSNIIRRGGFSDLLHLYTERMHAILQDEDEDSGVIDWLKENYGMEETELLKASNLREINEEEQIARLQHFAEWFRSVMPYYWDRCSSCSASYKDETASHLPAENEEVESSDNPADPFIGYIFPSSDELKGKASRTELYQCHKCNAYTRFPRFNSAHAIIDSKRGRCGEYSTLLYRFLRDLGLEARWVVDWADHVWAEILLEGSQERWVHFDPCEAAVDKPLLYQEWGKKQTYVVALYAPKASPPSHANDASQLKAPLVEDVTNEYTSDSWETIKSRRDESSEEVDLAIKKAISEMETKLGLG